MLDSAGVDNAGAAARDGEGLGGELADVARACGEALGDWALLVGFGDGLRVEVIDGFGVGVVAGFAVAAAVAVAVGFGFAVDVGVGFGFGVGAGVGFGVGLGVAVGVPPTMIVPCIAK